MIAPLVVLPVTGSLIIEVSSAIVLMVDAFIPSKCTELCRGYPLSSFGTFAFDLRQEQEAGI